VGVGCGIDPDTFGSLPRPSIGLPRPVSTLSGTIGAAACGCAEFHASGGEGGYDMRSNPDQRREYRNPLSLEGVARSTVRPL